MKVSQSVFFLVAVTTAVLAHPGDLYHGGYAHGVDHHNAYPRYDFNYGVHSAHTGDVKNQWEARDGDLVNGSYSLSEADGTIRQVEYTADKHNGFNAVVKKLGHAVHPHTVWHYGGAGYGGASLYGGAHYGALGASSYAGQYPRSYYGTHKLGAAFLGAGHLGSATSYASGNLRSFGHYAGHHGGATSNANSLAISHHGEPRYAVGHLGATSYASGYNGAVGHYGNHHNY